MYYNQELGLCIEFGPVRVDSVRRGGGGGGAPGSNPPCAGSRRRGLLPGLLVIACYLSFTPSSLKSFMAGLYTWPPVRSLDREMSLCSRVNDISGSCWGLLLFLQGK